MRANLDDPVGRAATIALVPERSAEADDSARRFWDDRSARMAVVVIRAVERGEVAAADAEIVIEVAVAPLFFRLLVRRAPLDDGLLRDAAGLVSRGVRAGAAGPG